jgi:hypothetical protein
MRSSETAENRKWAENFSSRLKIFLSPHLIFLPQIEPGHVCSLIRTLTISGGELTRRLFADFTSAAKNWHSENFRRIQSPNFSGFKIRDNFILRWLGTRIILRSNTSPVIHNRRRSRFGNRKCFLFDSTSFRPAAKIGNRAVPSSPSLFLNRAKLICWTARRYSSDIETMSERAKIRGQSCRRCSRTSMWLNSKTSGVMKLGLFLSLIALN